MGHVGRNEEDTVGVWGLHLSTEQVVLEVSAEKCKSMEKKRNPDTGVKRVW